MIGSTRLSRQGMWFNLALVAPAVLVLLVLVVYPLVHGAWLSLFDYNLMSRSRPFIGLRNFVALAEDTRFVRIVGQTVLFALIANGVSTIVGLGSALLLNKSGKLTGTLRAVGYLPWITPSVVFVYAWSWVLSGRVSPINHLMMVLGLFDRPITFIADRSISFLGLTLPVWSMLHVRIWASYPFKMVMLLAALQNIPQERYDAAYVDGANRWQQFVYIVLPGILPVLMIVVLLSSIWNLSHFEVNFLLTGGGPSDLTNVVPIFIYNLAFVHFRLGLAAAAGMYVFGLAALFGALYIWVVKRERKNR